MRTYDLVVMGAGSGNMLFGPDLDTMRAAVIDGHRLGVHATLDRIDWPGIRDRVFGRIDPLHDSAADFRRSSGIDVYLDPALRRPASAASG